MWYISAHYTHSVHIGKKMIALFAHFSAYNTKMLTVVPKSFIVSDDATRVFLINITDLDELVILMGQYSYLSGSMFDRPVIDDILDKTFKGSWVFSDKIMTIYDQLAKCDMSKLTWSNAIEYTVVYKPTFNQHWFNLWIPTSEMSMLWVVKHRLEEIIITCAQRLLGDIRFRPTMVMIYTFEGRDKKTVKNQLLQWNINWMFEAEYNRHPKNGYVKVMTTQPRDYDHEYIMEQTNNL